MVWNKSRTEEQVRLHSQCICIFPCKIDVILDIVEKLRNATKLLDHICFFRLYVTDICQSNYRGADKSFPDLLPDVFFFDG